MTPRPRHRLSSGGNEVSLVLSLAHGLLSITTLLYSEKDTRPERPPGPQGSGLCQGNWHRGVLICTNTGYSLLVRPRGQLVVRGYLDA